MVSKISGSDVREHQFKKKFLVFTASKVTRFSFSCELLELYKPLIVVFPLWVVLFATVERRP